MEEIFAFIFLAIVLLGYLALCAGVGYFAHKNDQSFILFFILSIMFSPVPVFVLAIIVSVATGTLGASNERKAAKNAGQTPASDAKEASSKGSVADEMDDDTDASSIERSSLEGGTDDALGTRDTAGDRGTETPTAASGEEDEDEPYPWEEESDEAEGSDRSGEPAAPEGKVRCDVCHSFVDETEDRCPACGNRLG